MQFRIRWKNYGSDDDTWESVENVRGAKEILEEYKRTHDLSKPKGARLSTASKPKSATKKQRGRALSTEIDASDSEAAPSPKKRKRGSQPKPKPSSGIASLRKNGTGGASKADMASAKNSKVDKENHVPESDAESNTSLPDEEYAKKYLKGTSWENLVQKVRTVKVQTEDNQSDHEDSDENENKVKDLKVCLLLKDQGRMIWCPNATARKKCPQKLLDFYEEHLQFAAVDEE